MVDERDAGAALGLVEVGRRQQDASAPRAAGARGASRSRGARRGRRPVVGSSRTSSSGVWMSVQTSASFCFMPPESRSARRSRNGVIRTISSSCVAPGGVAAHVVDLGEEGDVLVDGQVAVEREALREVADAAREPAPLPQRVEAAGATRPASGAAGRGSCAASWSCRRRRGRSGRTSRRGGRRSVTPSTATIAPKRRVRPSARTSASGGGAASLTASRPRRAGGAPRRACRA